MGPGHAAVESPCVNNPAWQEFGSNRLRNQVELLDAIHHLVRQLRKIRSFHWQQPSPGPVFCLSGMLMLGGRLPLRPESRPEGRETREKISTISHINQILPCN